MLIHQEDALTNGNGLLMIAYVQLYLMLLLFWLIFTVFILYCVLNQYIKRDYQVELLKALTL